jgi:predicted Zn-dependent peptidase
LINTELETLLKVTPAEIQAAAKKYLTPERRSVLEIVPAPKPQPSSAAKESR